MSVTNLPTGNELAFDVDLSQVDCGLNGALYFVQVSQTSLKIHND